MLFPVWFRLVRVGAGWRCLIISACTVPPTPRRWSAGNNILAITLAKQKQAQKLVGATPASSPPEPPFTIAMFIHMVATALGHAPDAMHAREIERLQEFWKTHQPLRADTVGIAMAKTILMHGNNQHLDVYLNAIKALQLRDYPQMLMEMELRDFSLKTIRAYVGHLKPSYNSCRNRNCPKCGALAKERCLAARKKELLRVRYFHDLAYLGPESVGASASALHRDRWRVVIWHAAPMAWRFPKLKHCQEILGVATEPEAESTPAKSWEELVFELTGQDPRICPKCGKGRMITKEILPARRVQPVRIVLQPVIHSPP